MKVAVVGATGLVGAELLSALQRFDYPVTELIPVASERSAGKLIAFAGQQWEVCTHEAALQKKPNVALFSAGATVSREWGPKYVEAGALVVDNSSAWRMEPHIPLVVPEVNLDAVGGAKLIANPNCSTIQLVVALAPLHKAYGIKRLIVSTYQSVTGTGKAAVDQLMAERNNTKDYQQVYPHRIDLNCIPQCDVFVEDGYTKEEMKVVNETRKILNDQSLQITCTAVRVPVIGGHSESVNVEFHRDFDLEEVKALLAEASGVVLQDDPSNKLYPMPGTSHNRDEVFVGRLRRDFSNPNSLNMWVVADNLRKGAATNTVQIAKALLPAK